MIPRFRPHWGLREWWAALSFWQKRAIEQFEIEFAAALNQRFALAFPYGRTGIWAVLKSLNLENKSIVCPSYTCVVVAHAVKYSGNEPVFIDSQANDFNMDLEQVLALSDRPGAIIATSIFGHPVNLSALDRCQKKWPGIAIIQDCCHSFGAEWQGQPVHKSGKASIFALNISKIINSIFGGMVLTDDPEFYRSLKQIRDQSLSKASLSKSIKNWLYMMAASVAFQDLFYGFTYRLTRWGALSRFVDYFKDDVIDMPTDYLMQMSPLQARVGRVQLSKYQEIVRVQRACAQIYFEELKDLTELKLPPYTVGATYSHFVVLTDHAREIVAYCARKGIQLGEIIEYNVGDLRAYKSAMTGKYPVARSFLGKTLNLPVGGITDAKKTSQAIKDYFRARIT